MQSAIVVGGYTIPTHDDRQSHNVGSPMVDTAVVYLQVKQVVVVNDLNKKIAKFVSFLELQFPLGIAVPTRSCSSH